MTRMVPAYQLAKQSRMGLPLNCGLLAEFEGDDPNADDALAQIDEALALAEQTE